MSCSFGEAMVEGETFVFELLANQRPELCTASTTRNGVYNYFGIRHYSNSIIYFMMLIYSSIITSSGSGFYS